MSQHSSNVRYQLAKKMMDDLYIKWITMPDTFQLVQDLIRDPKHQKIQVSHVIPECSSAHIYRK